MADDPVLPDVLAPNLRVVFCGTAASSESAAQRAYYAGPGNSFWPVLYEVNLTPVRLFPHQFRQVLHYGIGLTDIVKYVSGRDSDLRSGDYDGESVRQKALHYAPAVLAFNGKRAARHVLSARHVPYGWLNETLGSTRLIVLPSTSGAARRYWDITYWQALANVLKPCDSGDLS